MKLHLECERTIHFQKVDGTQGVLKEGAQAYMHFITSKKIDKLLSPVVQANRFGRLVEDRKMQEVI